MAFQPDQLTVRPSLRLRWLAAATHGCALIALGLSGLPTALSFAIALLVLGSGWRLDQRVLSLQQDDAIIGLRWDASRLWIMCRAQSQWLEADPLPASRLFTFALSVEMSCADGHQRRLLLLPDAVNPAGFRRLQVWLAYRTNSPSPQS